VSHINAATAIVDRVGGIKTNGVDPKIDAVVSHRAASLRTTSWGASLLSVVVTL
jgi:hypothetical protein